MKTKAKAAIVNADDFGLTRGVNRGILEAHRDGILTSASLLANMPGFEDAVRAARENPALGVGVHLNLVRGRALRPPGELPTLLDRNGCFFPPGRLALRLLLGRVSQQGLMHELDAQVARAVDGGLRPTHLDTEKHMHMFPAVLRALIEVARRHGIGQVRWGDEPLRPAALLTTQGLKALGKRVVAARGGSLLRANGLRHADHFRGLLDSGRVTAATYRRFLTELPDGVTEISCHPGYADAELDALAPGYINAHREEELLALAHPSLRELCRERSIRLMHYGELAGLAR